MAIPIEHVNTEEDRIQVSFVSFRQRETISKIDSFFSSSSASSSASFHSLPLKVMSAMQHISEDRIQFLSGGMINVGIGLVPSVRINFISRTHSSEIDLNNICFFP